VRYWEARLNLKGGILETFYYTSNSFREENNSYMGVRKNCGDHNSL
jgi:hypothetical protein